MSRFAIVPGAAAAATALLLSACSGAGSSATTGMSSTTGTSRTTAAAPSSSAPPPSSTPPSTSKPAPSTKTDALSSLDRSKFAGTLLTPIQVAVFAPDMAKDTSNDGSVDSGDPAEGDTTYSGEGGSCHALAVFFNKSGLFTDNDDDNEQVSYDNSDVAQSTSQLRAISQIVETQPSGDPVADVSRYRAAVNGCSTALVGDDGSRVRVRSKPVPAGLGKNAFAVEATFSGGGESFKAFQLGIASGKNAMAVLTSGFGAAQRSRILAQVQKNLKSAPADAASASSDGSI